jgi:hypothetical protein
MSHVCPAPGCETQVPAHMLACRPDWYRIPKPYRQAIWRAWRDGAGAGSLEHRAAVTAAKGWLEDNPRGAD